MAFVSDRGGTPQLYTMDADGGDVQKVDVARHGLCDRPGVVAQRPTAGVQLAAPDGNYDIYVMDIATHALGAS